MKRLKRILKITLMVLAGAIGGHVLMNAVNVLQNGARSWDGRSPAAILGKDPARADLLDLRRLSKAELMQLFYASPPPDYKTMGGRFEARLLSVGVMAPATAVFTHNFFGPGHWVGKSFQPGPSGADGTGDNLFSDGSSKAIRARKNRIYIGPSLLDKKVSMHLDYAPYNGGLVHSMRDEVRMINTSLYLGMGHMALGGGSINPAPFVLMRPAKPAGK